MRMKTRAGRRALRAFTMTEMAIVLGIFGIVVGGLWAAYGWYSDGSRLSKTIQQVGLVAQNIRDHYQHAQGIPLAASCNNATDLTTLLDSIPGADIFSPEMRLGTAAPFRIISAFGGFGLTHTFRVLGSATNCTGAGQASRFRIVLTNLSQGACAQLLFAGVNYQDQSIGIRRLCASNAAGCSGNTAWSAEVACANGICTSPAYTTVASINALCTAAANEVGWEFLLRH